MPWWTIVLMVVGYVVMAWVTCMALAIGFKDTTTSLEYELNHEAYWGWGVLWPFFIGVAMGIVHSGVWFARYWDRKARAT